MRQNGVRVGPRSFSAIDLFLSLVPYPLPPPRPPRPHFSLPLFLSYSRYPQYRARWPPNKRVNGATCAKNHDTSISIPIVGNTIGGLGSNI